MKKQALKLRDDILLYPVIQRNMFTPIDEEKAVCIGFDDPIMICDIDAKRLAILEGRRSMRAQLKRKRKKVND